MISLIKIDSVFLYKNLIEKISIIVVKKKIEHIKMRYKQSNPRWKAAPVKLYIYHAKQCDPKKCTARKLEKHRLVKSAKWNQIPRGAVILNPFATRSISCEDYPQILEKGLVGIDCSWKKIDDMH
ncbi:MAG: hypothetical protein ACFFD2_07770, partial [Promethearchaeota archaeon]